MLTEQLRKEREEVKQGVAPRMEAIDEYEPQVQDRKPAKEILRSIHQGKLGEIKRDEIVTPKVAKVEEQQDLEGDKTVTFQRQHEEETKSIEDQSLQSESPYFRKQSDLSKGARHEVIKEQTSKTKQVNSSQSGKLINQNSSNKTIQSLDQALEFKKEVSHFKPTWAKFNHVEFKDKNNSQAMKIQIYESSQTIISQAKIWNYESQCLCKIKDEKNVRAASESNLNLKIQRMLEQILLQIESQKQTSNTKHDSSKKSVGHASRSTGQAYFHNLDRMIHLHINELKRLQKTVSVQMFKSMIDNSIEQDSETDNQVDLDEAIRMKKDMNKLAQYEKVNNLYKMKSGITSIHSHAQEQLKSILRLKTPSVDKARKLLIEKDLFICTSKSFPASFQQWMADFHTTSTYERLYSLAIKRGRKMNDDLDVLQRKQSLLTEMNKGFFDGQIKSYKNQLRCFIPLLGKNHQIYNQIMSVTIDDEYFRNVKFLFKNEFMKNLRKIMEGIHQQNQIKQSEEKKDSIQELNHFSSPSDHLLSKALGYRIGQKIFVQTSQAIETRFTTCTNTPKIELKNSFKSIDILYFDESFMILERIEPRMQHELYKYPKKTWFDFKPIQDQAMINEFLKKKKIRQEIQKKRMLNKITMLNNLKYKKPSKELSMKEDEEKLIVKKEEKPIVQAKNDIQLNENKVYSKFKKNGQNSNNSSPQKPGNYFSNPKHQDSLIARESLNQIGDKMQQMQLTIEVWEKPNAKVSPSTKNADPNVSQLSPMQKISPSKQYQLLKFKGQQSQSDTALDQQVEASVQMHGNTAQQISLFKGPMSELGIENQNKGAQKIHLDQSMGNLPELKSTSNELVNPNISGTSSRIRRKSLTQKVIKDGDDEGRFPMVSAILRDIDQYVDEDFTPKFDINNLQKQGSNLLLQKKRTQKYQQKHKPQEEPKKEQELKKDQKQGNGSIASRSRKTPLLGEIKSQSFTDEYELLVKTLGKTQAEQKKKKSKFKQEFTHKSKSQKHLLLVYDVQQSNKDDESNTDKLDSINEPSFSFSSSEFLSLEQNGIEKALSSCNSSSCSDTSEEDDFVDRSSLSSYQFKSMSTNLIKKLQGATSSSGQIESLTGTEEKRFSDPSGAIVQDEKARSNSLIKSQKTSFLKNLKTHKFLTGSHSNDNFDQIMHQKTLKKELSAGGNPKQSQFNKQNVRKRKTNTSSYNKRQSFRKVIPYVYTFFQKKGSASGIQDEENMKKILECINDRNINNLKEYLKRFIGLNLLDWTDEEGNTLVHKCVAANFIGGVELLLNMGLQINAQNKRGNTPLHNARYLGNTKMVDFLISMNAKQALKNSHGLTPWEIELS